MKNNRFLVCVIAIITCFACVLLICGVGNNFGRVPDNLVLTFMQAGNESAAFEWQDQSATAATVYFRQSGTTKYIKVDDELIRQISPNTARVDIVGLKVGVQEGLKYDFKIVASWGAVKTVKGLNIAAYDRSGFAHFNYNDGVGAYQDDGSPKDNAVIVYVNENNKNTVTATVNGKKYTGLVDILNNVGKSTPLIVRILGTIGTGTWNQLEYNEGEAITPDYVKGINGKSMLDFYQIDRTQRVNGEIMDSQGNYYHQGTDMVLLQEQLIIDGFNTFDTSVYNQLNGLRSEIKYNSSVDEFDSLWNECSIVKVKNVTVEGIGSDARIFQWGMKFWDCDSIEVRNLTFEAYPEDACSAGGSDKNANDLSDFQHGNIWFHHNTFEKGVNYWDVCNEQDKHDGDGSTDLSGIKNITVAYNVYNYTQKTGLVGGNNSETTANVTFHHNVYNHCAKRLPRARQANIHLYNNYFNGTTFYDLRLQASTYAFMENCYFENSNNCPVELLHDDSYGDGWIKIINCVIDESKIFVENGVNQNTNLYIGTDRTKQLNTTNRFGSNFDTDTELFYYDGIKTVVTEMLTTDEVKNLLPHIAGVMKRINLL